MAVNYAEHISRANFSLLWYLLLVEFCRPRTAENYEFNNGLNMMYQLKELYLQMWSSDLQPVCTKRATTHIFTYGWRTWSTGILRKDERQGKEEDACFYETGSHMLRIQTERQSNDTHIYMFAQYVVAVLLRICAILDLNALHMMLSAPE